MPDIQLRRTIIAMEVVPILDSIGSRRVRRAVISVGVRRRLGPRVIDSCLKALADPVAHRNLQRVIRRNTLRVERLDRAILSDEVGERSPIRDGMEEIGDPLVRPSAVSEAACAAVSWLPLR